MGQRSPYNDRYKVDQKGKTRRSASSAKPKRDLADLTPATAPGSKPKKKGFFARAAGSSSKSAPAPVVTSPRLKQLRLVWWVLWVVALGTALGILLLQNAVQKGNTTLGLWVTIGWVVWFVSMGAAFYLEFVVIRKERNAIIDANVATSKGGKSGKPSKAASGGKARPADAPAPDDRQPPDSEKPS